jgi:protein-S-isoprenylcysteine O-methyltransferase Ste14
VIGSGKKGFAAFLEKSFLVFYPVWLIEIGIHSLHLNIQFLPLVMVKLFFKNQNIQFAGAVVIFVGLLVFCLALISFSSSWRVGIDTVSPGGLITTGVFSATRNPIFLSMDLYFLGTFLMHSNLFFFNVFRLYSPWFSISDPAGRIIFACEIWGQIPQIHGTGE